MSEKEIVGPLGWRYPILNLILRLLSTIFSRTTILKTAQTYSNIEEYEIFEENGVIKMRIHRHAEKR